MLTLSTCWDFTATYKKPTASQQMVAITGGNSQPAAPLKFSSIQQSHVTNLFAVFCWEKQLAFPVWLNDEAASSASPCYATATYWQNRLAAPKLLLPASQTAFLWMMCWNREIISLFHSLIVIQSSDFPSEATNKVTFKSTFLVRKFVTNLNVLDSLDQSYDVYWHKIIAT